MNKLFYKLPQNFMASFWGYNSIFHIAAILLTYIILNSGFDWFYFVSTQIPSLEIILFPAIIVGVLTPFIVPVVLYVIGIFEKKQVLTITACALGQAVLLGYVISSLFKVFTGRIQPNLINIVGDLSHSFQFGFFRHGIVWGWPSTHTTIAFAMALTLVFLYRKNKFIVYGALLYAFYIGIGISTSIHWFSDFVAGALIGTAIGIAVGKSFRRLVKNKNS